MKKIYILDECQSSKKNGIGVFVEELIYCLQQLKADIFLVSFNSDFEEFNITKREDGIMQMHFPPLFDIFTKSYIIIEKFFRLYIEDLPENIFFLNHFPCEDFLKVMKCSYPLSKFLLVIHNQMWTTYLMGDSKRLKRIISEKGSDIIRNEYAYFVDNFEVDQRTYNIADGVICLCDDTYRVVKDIYKTCSDLYLIKNGCRDSCRFPVSMQQKQAIRERLNIGKDEKILICVGCICSAKGMEVLIKSFCTIAKEKSRIRLVIAGSPLKEMHYDYLFKMCRDVFSRISFLGQISHLDIKDWYMAADIGIFPSYTEQCSFTGIEMMMYGLPIIASDGFGVRNMFINSVNAKIARIGRDEVDYEGNMVEAIRELLNSETTCGLLGQNARKIFEMKYNINNMIKEYGSLLYSLR